MISKLLSTCPTQDNLFPAVELTNAFSKLGENGQAETNGILPTVPLQLGKTNNFTDGSLNFITGRPNVDRSHRHQWENERRGLFESSIGQHKCSSFILAVL